ncbi:DUF262 domain-containing protein [Cupriavidus necator]|uniref:DUF262 domain-containing protein n=2 Tax=Cupriavidus necator (strain ATCC 17699 / DSM 428 / KCTC 22496 / NCIMB 10442 / H16 / Stanier 337) TaxID=381666 RepID=A0AAE5ZFJ7_CUPNH|nr:DUF262 domain-containing protein [Cupriavidus necator]QCC01368.1 DUF262 domain-containing protein [Cupriavidus necator H16]QQB75802.1 DUF262 domain-containing protein [Cupriavidus necator]WKA39756.1 DUF262 domain-containing protein [Cupriavidus necator]
MAAPSEPPALLATVKQPQYGSPGPITDRGGAKYLLAPRRIWLVHAQHSCNRLLNTHHSQNKGLFMTAISASLDQPLDINEDQVDEWYESEDDQTDVSVSSTSDDIERKYAETQLRVVRSTMDFTLHQLQASLRESNYINMAPGYQRRARWDRKKKSLLIESILLNVPIPSLFLFEANYNQYEVMDGRQRLETITDFLDNDFALTGLEYWPEINSKRFRDLPEAVRRGLLRRTIGAVVLLAETARGDGDFDIRMVLFRRLNTGGVKLNPQELRNAAFPGTFNAMIKRLSREDSFANVWGIPRRTENEEKEPAPELTKNILYQSMMDCELVLRFFAIRETISGETKGSLRHILDRTMRKYRNISNDDADKLGALFTSSINTLIRLIGPDFIVLPGTKRPSRPLYDALMVAASTLSDSSPPPQFAEPLTVKDRLTKALSTKEDYDILVGRGNTVEAIKARVALARTILSA